MGEAPPVRPPARRGAAGGARSVLTVRWLIEPAWRAWAGRGWRRRVRGAGGIRGVAPIRNAPRRAAASSAPAVDVRGREKARRPMQSVSSSVPTFAAAFAQLLIVAPR